MIGGKLDMENQFEIVRGFCTSLTGSGSTQAYCHRALLIIQPARRFAGHRPLLCRGTALYFQSYVPKYIGLTISRAGLCPVAPVPLYKRQPDGCDAGHRCSDYRPLRNASKRSSGRYRPGLPLGGVVLSRTSCFKARLASR